MKKTIYMLLGLLLAAGLTSCQDWFIEKPEVTGMDQDEVFSTAKNAEGAIAEAYATILSSGLPVLVWNNSPIMPYETTEAIMGGERPLPPDMGIHGQAGRGGYAGQQRE